MPPAEFKRKCHRYQGKESSACQEHFSDLRRLLGQPTPAEADSTGSESFCFQKRVVKDAELLFELREEAEPAEPRDRKSTRLNSSHSQISYAVFCLKKKKIWP